MLYAALYFGMGVFLVVIALLHKGLEPKKKFFGSIGMLFLWPLVLLVAPEALTKDARTSHSGQEEPPDPLMEQLARLAMASSEGELAPDERDRLRVVAKHGYRDVAQFSDCTDFGPLLQLLWSVGLHPRIYHSYKSATWELDERYDPDAQLPLFSLRQPEWYIGFSNEFVRSIAKVDRKVQGRILEALGKISASPVEVLGDTIKPLSGDLRGLWRYRVGDDRLVYLPDLRAKTIVLISFSSRGDVYEDLPDVSALLKKS